jgi:hypothetical protein
MTTKDDIVNKAVDKAAKKLAEHIDFEILKDVLIKSCGWHYVELPTLGSNRRAFDISEWAHAECKSDWKHQGRHWLFALEEDAIMFKLTWS